MGIRKRPSQLQRCKHSMQRRFYGICGWEGTRRKWNKWETIFTYKPFPLIKSWGEGKSDRFHLSCIRISVQYTINLVGITVEKSLIWKELLLTFLLRPLKPKMQTKCPVHVSSHTKYWLGRYSPFSAPKCESLSFRITHTGWWKISKFFSYESRRWPYSA